MDALTGVEINTDLVLLPADDLERLARHAASSQARATRRAYRADMAAWATWCASRGVDPLPAEPLLLAVYLAYLADSGAPPVTVTPTSVEDRRRTPSGWPAITIGATGCP